MGSSFCWFSSFQRAFQGALDGFGCQVRVHGKSMCLLLRKVSSSPAFSSASKEKLDAFVWSLNGSNGVVQVGRVPLTVQRTNCLSLCFFSGPHSESSIITGKSTCNLPAWRSPSESRRIRRNENFLKDKNPTGARNEFTASSRSPVMNSLEARGKTKEDRNQPSVTGQVLQSSFVVIKIVNG